MKLIREFTESVKYLVETPKGETTKNYFIEGVFLQGEIKNRNGRIYPDSPTINLDRVSHMIKELKLEGNNYVGKAKIMDTPYGKIVKSLIDEGANLGVSSRGMGSLRAKNDGTQLVQGDFMLATAGDIVADPSAPDAFVRGVMEGKEWVFVDGKFLEKDIEQVRKEIASTNRIALAEAQAIQFANFLKKIK